MKCRWTIALAVVVIAGLAAFAITRCTVCPAPAGAVPGLERLQDLSFLTHELTLSAEQVASLQALHTTLGTRLGDCCARNCDARARLAEALLAEPDAAGPATEALLAEMSRTYEDSERATLDHIRAVRALLTTEQRTHFDALITRCLCRTCPDCSSDDNRCNHDR